MSNEDYRRTLEIELSKDRFKLLKEANKHLERIAEALEYFLIKVDEEDNKVSWETEYGKDEQKRDNIK